MTTCKNCVKFKTKDCWCDENKVKETDPICLKFVGFRETPEKLYTYEEYQTREERIGMLNELLKQVKEKNPADWWDLYKKICDFL